MTSREKLINAIWIRLVAIYTAIHGSEKHFDSTGEFWNMSNELASSYLDEELVIYEQLDNIDILADALVKIKEHLLKGEFA